MGKEVAAVETTATVLSVNTEAEGEEATTAGGVNEIIIAAVDAEEAPMLLNSISGTKICSPSGPR